MHLYIAAALNFHLSSQLKLRNYPVCICLAQKVTFNFFKKQFDSPFSQTTPKICEVEVKMTPLISVNMQTLVTLTFCVVASCSTIKVSVQHRI